MLGLNTDVPGVVYPSADVPGVVYPTRLGREAPSRSLKSSKSDQHLRVNKHAEIACV